MVSARLSLSLTLLATVCGENMPDEFVDDAHEEACEMQQTLLQMATHKSRVQRQLATFTQPSTCSVGEDVTCPGGESCSGDQCCPDGSTCPSASHNHVEGCPSAKTNDCTALSTQQGACSIGEHLLCPDGSGIMCAGDQCCPDGSTCPSASQNHVDGCSAAKVHDCTVPTVPAPAPEPVPEERAACETSTGGTCEHIGCYWWRNAQCVDDQCLCPAGTCAVDGVCHADPASAPAPAPSPEPAPSPAPAPEPAPAPVPAEPVCREVCMVSVTSFTCRNQQTYEYYDAPTWEAIHGECTPDGSGGSNRISGGSPSPYPSDVCPIESGVLRVSHFPTPDCSGESNAAYSQLMDGMCIGSCTQDGSNCDNQSKAYVSARTVCT